MYKNNTLCNNMQQYYTFFFNKLDRKNVNNSLSVNDLREARGGGEGTGLRGGRGEAPGGKPPHLNAFFGGGGHGGDGSPGASPRRRSGCCAWLPSRRGRPCGGGMCVGSQGLASRLSKRGRAAVGERCVEPVGGGALRVGGIARLEHVGGVEEGLPERR